MNYTKFSPAVLCLVMQHQIDRFMVFSFIGFLNCACLLVFQEDVFQKLDPFPASGQNVERHVLS
jgi:hypothetical protein